MEKNWLNIGLIVVSVAVVVTGAFVALDAERVNAVINAEDSPFIEDEFAYRDNGVVKTVHPAAGMKFEKITVEVVNMGNSETTFDLDDIVLKGTDGGVFGYDEDATFGYAKLTGNDIREGGNTVEPVWQDMGPLTVVIFYQIPQGIGVAGYDYQGGLEGGYIFNYS